MVTLRRAASSITLPTTRSAPADDNHAQRACILVRRPAARPPRVSAGAPRAAPPRRLLQPDVARLRETLLSSRIAPIRIRTVVLNLPGPTEPQAGSERNQAASGAVRRPPDLRPLPLRRDAEDAAQDRGDPCLHTPVGTPAGSVCPWSARRATSGLHRGGGPRSRETGWWHLEPGAPRLATPLRSCRRPPPDCPRHRHARIHPQMPEPTPGTSSCRCPTGIHLEMLASTAVCPASW